MKKKRIFSGISCAIATPFSDSGEIDYEAFSQMIDHQLAGGCRALTVCGTTGEAATLSDKEHFELISFAVKRVGGRIPVIAGNGSNCTSHSVELSHAAREAGCDALLTVTPYYNKANPDGLISSFSSIADATPLPLIIYTVPSRTGVSVPIEVYKELSSHERICAVKDATGSIQESMRLIRELSGSLDVYCGNDDLLFPMLSIGCAGGISVISNLLPAEMQRICDLFFSGRTRESLELQYFLSPLIEALFCDVNPIPLKHALSRMGLCSSRLRLPLCDTDSNKKREIDRRLSEFGLI